MKLTICTITVIFASVLQAQHVFYNQKQDKTAQDAAAAAKDITSGALFDNMLRNIDAQSRQEADTVLAYVKEQMRAKLASVRVWHSSKDNPPLCYSLRCQLETVEGKLQRGTLLDSLDDQKQAATRLAEIRGKTKELEAAVRELQSAAKTKDPAVLELLSHLSNAKDIVGYAQKIQGLIGNKGLGKSLDEISSGLDEMILLFNTAKGIWAGYEAVNVDANSLRPPREVIELQLLSLEEDHIKRLSRIRANEHLEAGDALQRIADARAYLTSAGVWNSEDTIEHTLRVAALGDSSATPVIHANPEHLRLLLDALFQSVASLAPDDAPVRLASNRESDEERRYSILRSAVNSSTYDQTIQAAVDRLAIYYKSGIKPSDLAQLIFYITNTVAVPVIATK